MSKKTIVKVILKTSFILGKSLQCYEQKKWLLNTIQVEEQVTPKTRNRKLPCFSIFGDTSHMPTIQYLKD
jgi:hypothetical protein